MILGRKPALENAFAAITPVLFGYTARRDRGIRRHASHHLSRCAPSAAKARARDIGDVVACLCPRKASCIIDETIWVSGERSRLNGTCQLRLPTKLFFVKAGHWPLRVECGLFCLRQSSHL